MIQIDELLHRWLQASHPMVQPLTYADDWQLLTVDDTHLSEAFDRMVRFSELIRVPIDAKKTHFWATDAQSRTALRQRNRPVIHHGRALGAHMQFTRQHTNAAQMQRVLGMKPFWPRLKVSASPYHIKTRAIRMAAWPRALHGIAATLLSNEAFRSLRTGALAALGSDGAGVNPTIHLSLVEDYGTDPLYWAILTTLRTARSCGEPEVIQTRLAQMVHPDFGGPNNTICHTLLARIQKVGWTVQPDGLIQDMFGAFHLMTVGLAELTLRLSLAWPQFVAQQIQHRPALWGIAHAHVAHTRKWLRTLSVPRRAAFVKILNGAHITQDGKQHCDAHGSSICPWCESSDSRFHRFWICPRFEAIRDAFPSKFQRALPDLPESLTSYGWSLKPHTLRPWLTYFAQIPAPARPLIESLPSLDQPWVHIFTDGSCVRQHCSIQRYAAWSCLIAGDDPHCCAPLWERAGPLPGLVQSAYRAEVFAVIQALEVGQVLGRPIHVWSDCQAVVVQTRAIVQGRRVSPNHAHADLWAQVQQLVTNGRIPALRITKVSSHEDTHTAPDALHVWCYLNNARADAIAVQANLERGEAWAKLLSLHQAAVCTSHEVSRAVQHLQLQISLEVLKEQDVQKAEAAQGGEIPDPEIVAPALPTWTGLPALDWVPAAAIRWYGETQVRRIQSWFWAALAPQHQGPTRWVSHFQLYVDFQKATGTYGPVHLAGWVDSADHPEVLLTERPFKLRCRWFTKVWKEIMRHRGVELCYNFTRPASHYLNLHCGCVALPWPSNRLQYVDESFQRFLVTSATRDGSSLQSLPLALRDDRFEPVDLVDVGVQ